MSGDAAISARIRDRATEMFWELNAATFEVVLVPAPSARHSGHKVRAVQSANPEWYSELCSQYKSCRGIGRKRMKRPRTFIKKEHTLHALENLAKGEAKGVYAERILALIKRQFENEERQQKASVAHFEYDAMLMF